MSELAAEVLEGNGFFLDRSGSKATKLGEMLLRADNEVLRQRAALLRGAPVAVPFDNLFSIAARDRPSPSSRKGNDARFSLNELIARYENDPSRQEISNKTRVEDARTFSHLREVFKGHRPIAELGKKECRAFRDLICAIPKDAQIICRGMTAHEAAAEAALRNLPRLSAKGANKYLHKLSALMRFAIDNDLYDGANPAQKIALPHEHSIDDRDPFSSYQLKIIFSSAQYAAFASRRAGVGSGAAFWVPALALFMGLRQGEACQLMAHDFDSERGIDFVQIQNDCGRRLKTKNAKRKIPCHPHLLQLGLMDFVDRARNNGPSDRLFPEEEFGKDGHFSPYSKRFTRFLLSIGARKPKTSFHSFRHNFRDALRDAETPNEMVLAIGGWKAAQSSTGDTYGSRRKVPRLAIEIGKVEFAEFSLDALLTTSER